MDVKFILSTEDVCFEVRHALTSRFLAEFHQMI